MLIPYLKNIGGGRFPVVPRITLVVSLTLLGFFAIVNKCKIDEGKIDGGCIVEIDTSTCSCAPCLCVSAFYLPGIAPAPAFIIIIIGQFRMNDSKPGRL